jgi:hypothetical protein
MRKKYKDIKRKEKGKVVRFPNHHSIDAYRWHGNNPEFVKKVYYNAQKQLPQNETIHVAYLHG